MRLDGKVALITGAARGIGKAIAAHLQAEGAIVVLTDIRDDEGERAAAAIAQSTDRARYLHLDVRDEAQWERAITEVLQSHGHLDVLVNNAGVTGFEDGVVPHDPEHASLAAWRAVHATNLDGVFLGCKHAIAAMRRGRPHGAGGSIVNISSRSGLVGIPRAAAYASSKAAVRNHTKSVALYCAEEGLPVRCNSVHPAAILTPMWEAMIGNGPGRDERAAAYVRDTPMRRFGTSDEVAHLVTYLASDESAYTTGSEFNLDGGMLAGSVATPRPPDDA